MIKSTTDYDLFKRRNDNRAKGLEEAHVIRLMDAISEKNRLEFYPIVVTENYEVIQGQHRLEAATRLGVPIYYHIMKDFTINDMVDGNTTKTWSDLDFLHVYCENGYREYIKFREFMNKYRFSIKFCIFVTMGKIKRYEEFRKGRFVFPLDLKEEMFDWLLQSIECIKNNKGTFPFLNTVKFQGALLQMFRHPSFEFSKWITNLSRFSYKIDVRLNQNEYVEMLSEIYNFRIMKKIDFFDIKEGNE